MNVILQEAIIQSKLAMRQRTALFWSFVFPIVLLILFCSTFGTTPDVSGDILAGLICINTITGALYGIGVVLVAYREGEILRRYKLAPIKLWEVILGVCLSRVVIIALTTALMMIIARVAYKIVWPTYVGAFLFVFLAGTFMFCTLAFAVASIARTAQQASLLTQLIFLPMMFLSGATLPYETMSNWMKKIAMVLPATYSTGSLKLVLRGGGIGENVENLLVMGIVSLCCIVFSAKFFRWD